MCPLSIHPRLQKIGGGECKYIRLWFLLGIISQGDQESSWSIQRFAFWNSLYSSSQIYSTLQCLKVNLKTQEQLLSNFATKFREIETLSIVQQLDRKLLHPQECLSRYIIWVGATKVKQNVSLVAKWGTPSCRFGKKNVPFCRQIQTAKPWNHSSQAGNRKWQCVNMWTDL